MTRTVSIDMTGVDTSTSFWSWRGTAKVDNLTYEFTAEEYQNSAAWTELEDYVVCRLIPELEQCDPLSWPANSQILDTRDRLFSLLRSLTSGAYVAAVVEREPTLLTREEWVKRSVTELIDAEKV